MSARERKPRKDRERNRKALLSAAREVFANHGVDAPLDLVAKRAGLGNATLYRHFPTRQDLVVKILRFNLQRSSAAHTAALHQPAGWDGL
jgi:AcrR family transcriptional regulator